MVQGLLGEVLPQLERVQRFLLLPRGRWDGGRRGRGTGVGGGGGVGLLPLGAGHVRATEDAADGEGGRLEGRVLARRSR